MTEARTRLAPSEASAADARYFVRRALSAANHPALVEVALLLTSELVTNAVVHCRSEVELIVEPTPLGVRVAVHDRDVEHLPVLRERGGCEEGGRGIFLVAALAGRWGAEPVTSGKWVWFEVDGLDFAPYDQDNEY